MNTENDTDIAALLRGESRRMRQQARALSHTVDMMRDTRAPHAAAAAQVRHAEAIAEHLDALSHRVDNPPRRLPVVLLTAAGLAAMAAGVAMMLRRREEHRPG